MGRDVEGQKGNWNRKGYPGASGGTTQGGILGKGQERRGQYKYSSKSDRVQEVDRVMVCVGMREGNRGEDFLCNDE